MENSDTEIVVVTFENHYGCVVLKQRLKESCVLRPVPRALSSSCGTCAFVRGLSAEEVKAQAPRQWQGIYIIEKGSYRRLYEQC